MAEETNFTEEEKQKFINFNETMCRYLDSEDKVAAEIAQYTINFILRQFNSSSLKGVINAAQHTELLDLSSTGLFEICYLKNPASANDYDFIMRDELFLSSFSLIVLYLSLALDGKQYKMEMARIEASKQTNVKLQQ